MKTLTDNILFGLILSLLSYELGLFLYRKTKFELFNPLLIAIISTILFLVVFHIDIKAYDDGAKFINAFLGPATVVLAVPLYNNIQLLKENFLAIIIGIFSGCIVAISSIVFLCIIFGYDKIITASLLPKSVTTPIGIEISNSLGGMVPITVLSIIISGIIGSVVGPTVCKIFKIKNNLAIGISLGTASHAIGTTKAFELGETAGAMSSLAIGLAGITTVFLAPLCFSIINFLIK